MASLSEILFFSQAGNPGTGGQGRRGDHAAGRDPRVQRHQGESRQFSVIS